MSTPDLPDLLNLSDAERIQRAQDELDRRIAAHHSDPASAIPWDQAKAELRRRFAT